MDLRTHIEQFSGCLSRTERPIGMLLGAGCAKSVRIGDKKSLIPDTKGMTKEIKNTIKEDGRIDCFEQILEVGEFEAGDDLNIEDVLNLVRDLRPHAGDGEIRGLTADELRYLEETICEEICEMVDVDLPSHEDGYSNLAKWISSIERTEPVEIFTTNYDLLIEKSLEKRSVPYFDGFIGSDKPFFDSNSVLNDELPEHWMRLWKVHGSINWKSNQSNGSIDIWRSNSSDGNRAVIHPSHMKYDQSRKMPYLALLDRLKEFLDKPESMLFVIGYSFGDQHLNETIVDALQGTSSSQVFAFLYSNIDSYDEAIEIAHREPNLNLLAEDGGVIGGERETWKAVDSDDSPDDDILAIDWEQEAENKLQQKLTLGDFQKFGRFLNSVVVR